MSGSDIVRGFYDDLFKRVSTSLSSHLSHTRNGKEELELTPTATAIRIELQRKFEEAVEEMDADDQEIIAMRHFEKLTNQEVAKVLNLSEPVASMRYLRAMRRLREKISSDGSENE